MRELDVLLERFVERRYDGAPEEIRRAFGEFLALSDPDILGLLTGRTTSDDPALSRVVELVRAERIS
jgi:succinate dehydrogenase flavin-adding protein (antitoxin of CptAB toxin-antitoxin module)